MGSNSSNVEYIYAIGIDNGYDGLQAPFTCTKDLEIAKAITAIPVGSYRTYYIAKVPFWPKSEEYTELKM